MVQKITLEIALDRQELLDAAEMLTAFARVVEFDTRAPGIEPEPAPTGTDTAPTGTAPASTGTAPAPTGTDTASTGTDTASTKVDANGMPWDERIHASTKAQLSDGTWRMRRCPKGTDKDEWDAHVKAVESELKSAESDAAAPTESDAASAFGATDEQPSEATPAPTDNLPQTFPDLLSFIKQRGLNTDAVTNACKQVGIEGFPLLAAQPDKIPQVAAILNGGTDG